MALSAALGVAAWPEETATDEEHNPMRLDRSDRLPVPACGVTEKTSLSIGKGY
jgi:hypothetical protein